MGLDIAFNKAKALEAGLKLVTVANGSPAEIKQAEEDGSTDSGYLAWLRNTEECIQVAGIQTINNGMDDQIVVRANRWGRVHAPLTEWLMANDISWDEF